MTRFIKPYIEMSMKEKYLHYDIYNIGVFDIETTNLDAEHGQILTIGLLIYHTQTGKTEIKTYSIKTKEIFRAVRKGDVQFDKRIIKEFLHDLKEENIQLLIGHYSHGWNKFDMPFLRARAFICKIEKLLPKHKEIRFADTWKGAHMLLKIHGYSLENVGDAVGAKTSKTKVSAIEWQLAKYGNKRGLGYVLNHNIRDVKRTYEIFRKIEEFLPIPASYV